MVYSLYLLYVIFHQYVFLVFYLQVLYILLYINANTNYNIIYWSTYVAPAPIVSI